MLYPDLRRLPLVCPTGMPPPPPVAGPAQRYALGQQDVVESILRSLGGGSYEDACRAAANWCALNREHREACKSSDAWVKLTEAVFPNAREPISRAPWNEPSDPMGWFFYLCKMRALLPQVRPSGTWRNQRMRRHIEGLFKGPQPPLPPGRDRSHGCSRCRWNAQGCPPSCSGVYEQRPRGVGPSLPPPPPPTFE